MLNWLPWFALVSLLGALLPACNSGSGGDCIRLTSSSRRCARPGYAAEPPPPAPTPTVSAAALHSTAAGWMLTTPERSVPGESALRETVWTSARPPFGTYDFIALRRITAGRDAQDTKPRPIFFFLPGAHAHGEIILTDERYDLRLYLAKRGIETWTLDYRTHFLPREQIWDSSFMQAWTAEAFIEDVIAAAQQVRTISGRQPIFLGGFGVGASFAALAAARSGREDLLGLVLLDGYVLDPPDADPLYRERTPTPNWFADDLEGRYMPYKRWMKILQDIIDDPQGPDFFPTLMFENRAQALAHFLYVNANFGARGGLSDAQHGRADVVMLARVFQNQDRYWPRVQNHGGFNLRRHLAGSQFDYEQALGVMNTPVLAFASGNMDKAGMLWSERVRFTAHTLSATDAQFRLLENWGHLDILWGTMAAQEVFSPVAEWITQRHIDR